jgi:hypothetical protein
MNRIDNSRFLLYIEPKKESKSETPINDEITEIMKVAFSESKSGAANYSRIGELEQFSNDGWRGWHRVTSSYLRGDKYINALVKDYTI